MATGRLRSIDMAWLGLIVAGLFETAWVICLDRSDGFRHWRWTVAFLVTLAVSMGLLGWSIRSLPVSAGYAVWVGIGAVGAALFGIVWLGEPMTWWRGLFLALLGSIVGLKLTSPPDEAEAAVDDMP